MSKETLLWKWALVVGLVAIAMLALYPPQDKLKPGIDLAGGTSLIYEIDTSDLSSGQKMGLAERVMNILKARVDPNSQFNLVWRPLGNNRLEIQMPRPPKEAHERRQAYEDARNEIKQMNLRRVDVEAALAVSGEERSAALTRLVRGVTERQDELEAVGQDWEGYEQIRGSEDVVAEDDALLRFEAALEAVLATNLPAGRLKDVLALKAAERPAEIKRLAGDFPSYEAAIEKTKVAYDAWSSKRGSLEDPADLKRLLRGAGVLEFRILADRDLSNPTMLAAKDPTLKQPIVQYTEQLQKRGPRPKSGDRYEWFPVDDIVKFLQLKDISGIEARIKDGKVVVDRYAGKYYALAHADPEFGLTRHSPKWTLKRAFPFRDPQTGRPAVDFSLDARGGRQFAELTKNNLQRQLTIFLDGVATSHATIQSQIAQRGQITGDFSKERVNEIVRKLEAGSLPARLKETPLLEKTTGPSLGLRNRELGVRAALYGLIAVGTFMFVYYLLTGVLANIALGLNLLFVLAIMAAMEATFTLPGIAGLLLTVGMAVDANVLIYERIREELARGMVLKKAVKAGYEKAFSTIIDANLTTLITCVILGYVGSEEVKGFAMTLGFGVVTSMFTALFVTRLILMALVEKGIVKSLPMLRLIGRPNVNWLGLRRVFWPVSTVMVCCGLGFFVYVGATDKESLYDIEFLGGTSVLLELAAGQDLNDEDIRALVTGANDKEAGSAAGWLREAADAMRQAKAGKGSLGGEYTMTSEKLTPAQMNTLLRTTFEGSLALGGFRSDGTTAVFVTKARAVKVEDKEDDNSADMIDKPVTLEDFKNGIEQAALYAENAATKLAGARIQTIADIGAEGAAHEFEIVTVEYNKELVRAAVLAAMGDKLNVTRPIAFTIVKDADKAPDGLFPIQDDYLHQVIGGDAPNDVRIFKGGVAFVFDRMDPPQTIETLDRRIREMRLQPQFEHTDWREYAIFGLDHGQKDESGRAVHTKIAMVVVDENLLYEDSPAQWRERLAAPELEQTKEALSAEKALRKVVQFAPQIASRTQQQALIAMVLALTAIVAYVWLRFGTMLYGLAAIVALVHDVSVVVGVITVADYLGIGDFRINLAMIAALLTVVGYSLNDTIVVFDRIRENRGKLAGLSSNIINNSINMTLSRTLLTSTTTLLAVGFLYFMGGPAVHGFAFALLGGVIVGTYSSVGIAAPLLQSPRLLRGIVYVLIAGGVVGLVTTVAKTGDELNLMVVGVVGVIMAVFAITALVVDRRMDEGGATMARA